MCLTSLSLCTTEELMASALPWRVLTTAILCARGWCDKKSKYLSVCIGFLYMVVESQVCFAGDATLFFLLLAHRWEHGGTTSQPSPWLERPPCGESGASADSQTSIQWYPHANFHQQIVPSCLLNAWPIRGVCLKPSAVLGSGIYQMSQPAHELTKIKKVETSQKSTISSPLSCGTLSSFHRERFLLMVPLQHGGNFCKSEFHDTVWDRDGVSATFLRPLTVGQHWQLVITLPHRWPHQYPSLIMRLIITLLHHSQKCIMLPLTHYHYHFIVLHHISWRRFTRMTNTSLINFLKTWCEVKLSFQHGYLGSDSK